ncbi:MAG: serine/threonine protein kinase [Planctomycetes bacterium]|nr:serine/threonine protein kinase [Planctomycetota bacterium]
MALDDCEILLGKLALGRSLLARPDAIQAVEVKASSEASGRPEGFGTTLVRLGLLSPRQIRELEEVLKSGVLGCSKCKVEVRLRGLTPAGAERCAGCGGGPLYVLAEGVAPTPDGAKGGGTILNLEAPTVEEEAVGGTTFLDLDAPEFSPPTSTPEEIDPRTEGTTELDAPDFGGPSAGEEADFRTERTMEFDAPDFSASDFSAPGSNTQPPADSDGTDFRAEKTLELDAPDFGRPSTPEADFRSERTMEFDAPDFGAGGASPAGKLIRGATTALPAAWDKEVSAALPADGEATQELDPSAMGDFQVEAFEPFEVGLGIKIMAPIARGGMGVVFRGQNPEGQVLAIKILIDTLSKNPEILARFEQEAVLTHGLDHPHIVTVHGAGLVVGGTYNAMPFFTMDYVAGRDLEDWVQERSRDPLESARILIPICDALNHAHGRGVVHRDIKPGNILVRAADEAPFLCDFGLAKLRSAASALTQTGDILGTPSYMAPEQARGEGKLIGPPTDVHAMGALLYFLLAGRPPFVGPTPFETLRAVAMDVPPSVRELNPAVSVELAAIVHKALQKAPQDRFHTAADMKAALAAL